jgi:hypothetical protein
VIKRTLLTVSTVVTLALGVALPAAPASAVPNSSRLAQCEKSAAERYARRAQSGDRTKAKRQFQNDLARCKRQFG